MKHALFPARTNRRGFTLVEVLATLLLMAIVIPAIMRGVITANDAGAAARHRNEAAGLAESKLDEIIATNEWQNQNHLAGSFGADWPNYKWEADINPWALDTTNANIQQVDVSVTWITRGQQVNQVKLSTLAYVRTPTQ